MHKKAAAAAAVEEDVYVVGKPFNGKLSLLRNSDQRSLVCVKFSVSWVARRRCRHRRFNLKFRIKVAAATLSWKVSVPILANMNFFTQVYGSCYDEV